MGKRRGFIEYIGSFDNPEKIKIFVQSFGDMGQLGGSEYLENMSWLLRLFINLDPSSEGLIIETDEGAKLSLAVELIGEAREAAAKCGVATRGAEIGNAEVLIRTINDEGDFAIDISALEK